MLNQKVRFRRVALGIGLINASLAQFGVAGGLLLLGVLKNWREAHVWMRHWPEHPTLAMTLESPSFSRICIVAIIVAMIARVSGLLGHLLCLTLPQDCPARKFIWAGIGFSAISGLFTVWFFLDQLDLALPVPPLLSWVWAGVFLMTWWFAIQAMRQLAKYIKRKDVKRETQDFWTFMSGFNFGMFSLFFLIVGLILGAYQILPWFAVFAFLAVGLSSILWWRTIWLIRQVERATRFYADLLAPRGGS